MTPILGSVEIDLGHDQTFLYLLVSVSNQATAAIFFWSDSDLCKNKIARRYCKHEL